MKLEEILLEAYREPKQKAGCLPYILNDGEPIFAFMVSSDSTYGGADPMIAKGGVDKGESIQDAAIREAEEELGLRKTNIINPTLRMAWDGELTGLTSTYKFSVYSCEVLNIHLFDPPGYETKEVRWMTAKDFNSQGRPSQRHIVNAVNDFVLKNLS